MIIGSGVTEIGSYAFVYSGLKSITIPDSVTSIGRNAFTGSDLTSITIPDGVTEINANVFRGCKRLTSVTIPSSVTYIGPYAFSDCDSLTRIVIPEGVTNIGPYAFLFAHNLKKIQVPASLIEIGNEAFDECTLYGVKGSAAEKFADENEYVEFVEGEIPALNFTDVRESDWYYDAVTFAYDTNIMTGLNATTFGPTEPLARAQFAVMLYRLYDTPEIEYTDRFPDVAEGVWYTNAILWAAKNGIITGYSNTGMFGPGDVLQRQQLAVMLYRDADNSGYSLTEKADITSYADYGSVDDYAKEALSWAVGVGIISGKSGGTLLDPTGNASRAETAIMLQRYLTTY